MESSLQCLHSTPPRGPRKSPTGGPGPWPNRRSILVFQIISCQSYTCDLRNQGKCLSKEEKFYSFQFGVGVRGKRGGNRINCRNQLQHLLPWTAGLVPVATGSNSLVHSKILKLIIWHIIWNTCLQCLHSTPPRGPRKSPTDGPGPWPNRRSILVFQIISCQSYTCDLRNQGKCNRINCRN